MILLRRIAHILNRDKRDAALREEMEFHLAMKQRELEQSGFTPEQARNAARAALGNTTYNREASHDVWVAPDLESLWRDIPYALRSLRRTPSFTIAAVFALGLGTGSAAAVFSLLDGVVLRPLPYREPQRIVMLSEVNHAKNLEHEPLSPVNFVDYRGLTSVFEDAAGWWVPQVVLTDGANDPMRVATVETSRNLFRVLGVAPQIGPSFTADTGLAVNGNLEAVISDRLWRGRFNGDRAIIGKSVRLNGTDHLVVGVMPPGFDFPNGTEIWEGLNWRFAQHSRFAHFVGAIGRLRPGMTPEGANRELARLTTRLAQENPPSNQNWGVRAVRLDREIAGVFRPGLFALLGASALLLVIACLNVANLLLARATTRRREVAVRAAIGASRGRLVRLFFTESLVLAALGATVGLGVAVVSVRALLAWSPIEIPRADGIGVSAAIFGFAIVIALLTAVVFGLAPALSMSRANLSDALSEGAKGSSSSGGSMRGALVVAEVSLAVMLLCGAALLIRSVGRLMRESIGIDASSVMTTTVQLPDIAYRDWSRVARFYASLGDALRRHPGIAAVGVSDRLPLDPGWREPYGLPGIAAASQEDAPEAQIISVDHGYFAALRAPIVAGRNFDARDDSASRPVVVVNETMAKRVWPGEPALGKQLLLPWSTIGPLGQRLTRDTAHVVVGVVRDIKNTSLRDQAEPAIYYSQSQFPFRTMHVVVRARSDVAPLQAALREEIRRLDPGLPVPEVKTLERVLQTSIDPSRFVMLLMTVFAVLALTIAAVGIYGILSYTVSRRRREIGIRLALGAEPRAIRRMIVRQGVTMAVVGCLVGVLGAQLGAGLLAKFMYETRASDPLTLFAVLAAVIVVALLACAVPGWRASGEDPTRALRAE
ncbi:MAG TPA: ABC transporter permease [Gemmatimonadaceae bacterium]|nr:ABC transporter permease [Gemmatimonadaceae bacterium]